MHTKKGNCKSDESSPTNTLEPIHRTKHNRKSDKSSPASTSVSIDNTKHNRKSDKSSPTNTSDSKDNTKHNRKTDKSSPANTSDSTGNTKHKRSSDKSSPANTSNSTGNTQHKRRSDNTSPTSSRPIPVEPGITRKLLSLSAVVDFRALDENELLHRKTALKNAVYCITLCKFLCIPIYVVLFFFARSESNSTFCNIIQVLTVLAILPQSINITLLVLGAKHENVAILECAVWSTLFTALYHNILGMMGLIYFASFGFKLIPILLCIVYGVMASSLLVVLCHDILIVYSLKELLYRYSSANYNTALIAHPS